MNKFIKWHKLHIGRWQNRLRINNYQTLWVSWIKGLIMGIILMIFLSGCYVYEGTYTQAQTTKHTCELMERGQACLSDHSCCKDPSNEISYWRTNYVPTIGLYYYNDLPYWGYYSGYYYYYGYRHIYPWWYYYNYIPSYYYSIGTHVHCHVGNNGYIYRPRGNWRHNNKTHLTYHHDKIQNTGIKVKNNSNVPPNWKNNTKTHIKTNTRINTGVKTNKSNTINKVNINKSNTKTNINRPNTNRNNTKININRNNSNRSNKGNTNRSNKRSNTKPR